MSKIEKLLAAMRNNPRGDWTIADLRRIAGLYGAIGKRPGSGSSHETFYHPDHTSTITIPDHGKIKAIYIQKFVAWIDSIKGNTP